MHGSQGFSSRRCRGLSPYRHDDSTRFRLQDQTDCRGSIPSQNNIVTAAIQEVRVARSLPCRFEPGLMGILNAQPVLALRDKRERKASQRIARTGMGLPKRPLPKVPQQGHAAPWTSGPRESWRLPRLRIDRDVDPAHLTLHNHG